MAQGHDHKNYLSIGTITKIGERLVLIIHLLSYIPESPRYPKKSGKISLDVRGVEAYMFTIPTPERTSAEENNEICFTRVKMFKCRA